MSRVAFTLVLALVLLFALPTVTYERSGAAACPARFDPSDPGSGCTSFSPALRLRLHPLGVTVLAGQALGGVMGTPDRSTVIWTARGLLAGKAVIAYVLAAMAMKLLRGGASRAAAPAPVRDDAKERKRREEERKR
jgi:hypothetical protein